jgi:hypothetical protein
LHGTSAISLPGKIGNARGALKVDGLDSNYGAGRLTLEEGAAFKKKKKKCC